MMARPRSDEKRSAIMKAAIAIIAAQGTSAPTAMIAKEAGVSNGALFTYFETKAELLNQLYKELKTEMALSTTVGLPTHADMHDQVLHVWNGWLNWAVANPQKRCVLAHLGVSNEVTTASRQAVGEVYADVEALLDRSRANGPLRDAPLMFVATLVTGMLDATVDYIARDPAGADSHAAAGFRALLRILG
ncbi:MULTISPECIES: TetR/AcrR family transcriptional regulator [unclassified Rhizobium]|uniref:TetR/AcrR family transcriptional regulator n=1 Tax=unclassified Rhizobium TaxID=2613769 RepID=UPI001ADA08A9|nr:MULTISPECIES: TetR/AcrR family transcriptional regulator [unclassified Rhizobium]MBO9136703.1 TetR/AcrR family transcriptional regulator [Rhizobium sp. B209b/85]